LVVVRHRNRRLTRVHGDAAAGPRHGAAWHAPNSAFAPRRSQTFAASAAKRGVFVPANSIVVGSLSRSTNGQRIYRLTQQVGGLQVYCVSAKGAEGNEGQALRAARRETNRVVIEKTTFFFADPHVLHVLLQDEDGSLNRGLRVETWSNTGNVLDVVSRIASDSYRCLRRARPRPGRPRNRALRRGSTRRDRPSSTSTATMSPRIWMPTPTRPSPYRICST